MTLLQRIIEAVTAIGTDMKNTIQKTPEGKYPALDGSLITKLSIPNTKLPMPVLANPNTTAETVVAKWLLPANYITPRMAIQANASIKVGIATAITWKLRIGATGTNGDPLVCTLPITASVALNSRSTVNFDLYWDTTNSVTGSGFAITNNVIQSMIATAMAWTTVNPAAPIYVSITATSSVATATHTVYGARVLVNN